MSNGSNRNSGSLEVILPESTSLSYASRALRKRGSSVALLLLPNSQADCVYMMFSLGSLRISSSGKVSSQRSIDL